MASSFWQIPNLLSPIPYPISCIFHSKLIIHVFVTHVHITPQPPQGGGKRFVVAYGHWLLAFGKTPISDLQSHISYPISCIFHSKLLTHVLLTHVLITPQPPQGGGKRFVVTYAIGFYLLANLRSPIPNPQSVIPYLISHISYTISHITPPSSIPNFLSPFPLRPHQSLPFWGYSIFKTKGALLED